MKLGLFYIFPTIDLKTYEPMARRFTNSYMEHWPGSYPHDLYVILNGARTMGNGRVFGPVPVTFLYHDNTGKDLGAYAMAARTISVDLMLCIGSPVRPAAHDWLDIMVNACLDHGPGMYSPFGCQVPLPHLRTTCFLCQPEILNHYPHSLMDNRYAAEHGRDSLSLWSHRIGCAAMQVTKRGVFEKKDWHTAEPDDCIMFDQHVDKHLLKCA